MLGHLARRDLPQGEGGGGTCPRRRWTHGEEGGSSGGARPAEPLQHQLLELARLGGRLLRMLPCMLGLRPSP